MNGNSSKQVLLSVLGIAILVVAVVGVSFAFFSYTKTGNANNTIQTGQIYTYLMEGDRINISNVMPLSTDLKSGQADGETSSQRTMRNAQDIASDGEASIPGSDVGVLNFTVTGMNQSETPIGYEVYLQKGSVVYVDPNAQEPEAKPRLKDSDMKLIMETVADGDNANGTIEQGLTTATLISSLTGSMDTGNIKIASGTFAADSAGTNTQLVHSYRINLYVDPNVKISDTDTTVNGERTRYCASHRVGTPETTTSSASDGNHGCELVNTGSEASPTIVNYGTLSAADQETHANHFLTVFSDAYYSIKIRVVANTTAGNVRYDYTGQAVGE